MFEQSTVTSALSQRDMEHPFGGKPSHTILLIVMLAMLALVGCGGGSSGGASGSGGGDTTGDDGYGSGDGDDSSMTLQATLASIQANVFDQRCIQCHTGASAPEGLRLEDGESHAMLVGIASSQVPELLRVDPGNPDDSYLIHKLEGTAAVGERMPRGGPYLDQATIDVIRQWITDGAAASVSTEPASKTAVTAVWPLAGESLSREVNRIVLRADGELDTSLLHAGNVELLRHDEHDPLAREPIPFSDITLHVTSLAPTTFVVQPVVSLPPGRYELRLKASDGVGIANRAGRLIDGDGDGQPGGDFVLNFVIKSP